MLQSGRQRSTGRALRAVTLGSLAALALTACGASVAAEDEAAASSPSGVDEQTALAVGYFPLVYSATAVHAHESGIFADEGLDVTLAQTGGGALAIPALVAGEHDIVYGNYTSALLAAQQGLPVQIVSGNDVGADDQALIVNADSPLRGAADLEGARIAVNNLQNIGTVAINAALEEAGVDISTIDFVELPFPEMQAVLARGDVDAIWQVEPFRASALAAGMRVLLPLFEEPVEGMPVAGWFTTPQFAEENPEVIDAFQRSIERAVDDVQGNRDLMVELVPTYTQVPAEVVAQVQLPTWDAEADVEQLQVMADLMLRYGILSEEFDVAPVVIPRD